MSSWFRQSTCPPNCSVEQAVLRESRWMTVPQAVSGVGQGRAGRIISPLIPMPQWSRFCSTGCYPLVMSNFMYQLGECFGMRLTFKSVTTCWSSGWNCTISSPGSPARWLQILGLLSIHNHVSQFLIYSLYLSILLFLFLWRTITNTGRKINFIMEKSGWYHLHPPTNLSISKTETADFRYLKMWCNTK